MKLTIKLLLLSILLTSCGRHSPLDVLMPKRNSSGKNHAQDMRELQNYYQCYRQSAINNCFVRIPHNSVAKHAHYWQRTIPPRYFYNHFCAQQYHACVMQFRNGVLYGL